MDDLSKIHVCLSDTVNVIGYHSQSSDNYSSLQGRLKDYCYKPTMGICALKIKVASIKPIRTAGKEFMEYIHTMCLKKHRQLCMF